MLNQFETALSTLTLIAAAGNTFLEVYILEDGRRTNLPPQAFDGHDVNEPMQSLQMAWEALLIPPVQPRPSTPGQLLLELMLQRIDQFENQMAEYDGSIAKLEALFRQTEVRLHEGPNKERLLRHYQSLIDRHYQSIGRVIDHRDRCLKSLSRLKRAH